MGRSSVEPSRPDTGKKAPIPWGNSDYLVLRAIFEGRVQDGDLLVDVGCGRGRVLNHWLGLRKNVDIVGIEIDPEIASETRRRLGRFANVTVLAGDAAEALPADASLLYLFNPFNGHVMERFKRSVSERCPSATLLYYHPIYLQIFREDPVWDVEEIDLKPALPRGYFSFPLAVLRMKVSSDTAALP